MYRRCTAAVLSPTSVTNLVYSPRMQQDSSGCNLIGVPRDHLAVGKARGDCICANDRKQSEVHDVRKSYLA